MSYVLIVVVMVGAYLRPAAPRVTMQEFSSLESCEAAKRHIAGAVAQAPEFPKPTMECVPR